MKDLAEKMKVERILDVCHNQEKKLKMWQDALINEKLLLPFEVFDILRFLSDKELPYHTNVVDKV